MLDDAIIWDCSLLIRKNYFSFHYKKEAKYCMICDSYFDDFLPFGVKQEVFSLKHIIGGGYRENCRCPVCGSSDRERWVFNVLKNHTDVLNMFYKDSFRVLHFAPERGIEEKIKANKICDYYTCDIEPQRAMHVVDVTDIQFLDNTFDYIIINHVLEHIIDEKKAILELKRVLKSNGFLIISFPICLEHKTIENERIKTPEERLNTYGQEDHVRLYGYDYKERLESYGLNVTVYTPKIQYSDEMIRKYGFIDDDILMICQKSTNS